MYGALCVNCRMLRVIILYYIDILRGAVRRSADLLLQGRNWTFQQDNDPEHTAINAKVAAVGALCESDPSSVEAAGVVDSLL